MKFHLIRSGENSGEYNMNFDLRLVEKCNSKQAFFRLYQWKPYAISLGANQKTEEINSAKTKSDGIDVVKRPTGGQAILHAKELTYSVALPTDWGFKPKELYEKISLALIRGLQFYDSSLKDVSLEKNQPNFGELLKTASGSICFASTAKNEVKFRGKKLIGSAQRKIKGKILQHGSILIGTFHRNLPLYLNIPEEMQTELINELEFKTIEIETILRRDVQIKHLEEAIISGWEKEWEIKF